MLAEHAHPHRQQALNDFRSGKVPVMVATDVVARGLHIKVCRVTVVLYPWTRVVRDILTLNCSRCRW